MKPRIIVVGAGHLGTYHLQKISKDMAAVLAGAVDSSLEARDTASRTFQVPAAAALCELAGKADAAIIATPTTTHHDLTLSALSSGLHVLVEKPIAATTEQAAAMIAAAARQKLLLQVGHSERFNPAIAAALAIADRPRYIVTERLGPFSGRSTDVDVILDLMIHDLDIVASLIPSPLAEVRAIGMPVLTNEIDMAAARLEFADGAVAQLAAGRASLEPTRKIRLFTLERYVSIDCVKREVRSVRRLPPEPGSLWPQITGEPIEVPPGDALMAQDHHFVECVASSRRPRVDGEAGLRALELAQAVKSALKIPLPRPIPDEPFSPSVL
jgi:predicted dehydrogenase